MIFVSADPVFFKILDLHVQTKILWEISDEGLEKKTHKIPATQSLKPQISFFLCKEQTICFSNLFDKCRTIPVSRCINFWLLCPFLIFLSDRKQTFKPKWNK